MNNWQEIGFGLEVKMVGKEEVWIRNQEQTSDYPHSTMILNDLGKVTSFYLTDPRAKVSIEGAHYLINIVSTEISQLQQRKRF